MPWPSSFRVSSCIQETHLVMHLSSTSQQAYFWRDLHGNSAKKESIRPEDMGCLISSLGCVWTVMILVKRLHRDLLCRHYPVRRKNWVTSFPVHFLPIHRMSLMNHRGFSGDDGWGLLSFESQLMWAKVVYCHLARQRRRVQRRIHKRATSNTSIWRANMHRFLSSMRRLP